MTGRLLRVVAASGLLACGLNPHPAAAQERLLCTVAVPLAEKPALPATSFDGLCQGLAQCWEPPEPLAGRDGIEVTVLLSVNRDGKIDSVPRLTYAAGVSTREDRESLSRATIEAIRRCPAPMTPALAGRIAGHQTFLRIIYKKPKQGA